jgi:protein-S-isoprenylcysteine O-methyltransferase Ste14
MSALAIKVPPPIAAAILAVAMWLISSATVTLALPNTVRISLVVFFAIAGAEFSLAGAIALRQAKTTVNPTKPENASSLVVTGVYRITRNPMYVGLLLMLVAWCIFLSAPWAIAGPNVFFLYIGKFQIAPEEQVMTQKFGADYLTYKARVHRWL